MTSILKVDTLQDASGTGTPYIKDAVLQVKSYPLATALQTQSTTYVTTGLTLSITPQSTSSKILIRFIIPSYINASNYRLYLTLFRGTVSGTNLATSPSTAFADLRISNGGEVNTVLSGEFLDSPSTSSSVTYTVGYKVNTSAAVGGVFRESIQGNITLMEIGG